MRASEMKLFFLYEHSHMKKILVLFYKKILLDT